MTRRTTATLLATFARTLGLSFALHAVLIAMFVAIVLQWLPPTPTLAVLLVLACWCALAIVLTLAHLAPGYVRIYGAGAAARRAHSPAQRRADRDLYRAARWSLDSVASRLPVGGLTTIAQHLRRTLPPGDSVLAQAATPRHVTVYRRYGFTPLPTAPLTLHATVGPVPQPAHSSAQDAPHIL